MAEPQETVKIKSHSQSHNFNSTTRMQKMNLVKTISLNNMLKAITASLLNGGRY